MDLSNLEKLTEQFKKDWTSLNSLVNKIDDKSAEPFKAIIKSTSKAMKENDLSMLYENNQKLMNIIKMKQ